MGDPFFCKQAGLLTHASIAPGLRVPASRGIDACRPGGLSTYVQNLYLTDLLYCTNIVHALGQRARALLPWNEYFFTTSCFLYINQAKRLEQRKRRSL